MTKAKIQLYDYDFKCNKWFVKVKNKSKNFLTFIFMNQMQMIL